MVKVKKILTLLIVLITLQSPVYAMANSVPRVVPEIDKNLQIEGYTYINYDVTKTKEKELPSKIKLTNNNEEIVEIEITLRNGLTSKSGEVYETGKANNYSEITDEYYMLENYIQGLPKTVELNPGETKELEYTIKVPENLIGRVIGGIGFTTLNKNSGNEEGLNINIQSGYVFSVWLNGEIKEINDIKIKGVEVKTEGSDKGLVIGVENNEPNFQKDKKISYKIIEKKNNEVLFGSNDDLGVISPKNKINHPVKWEGKMKEGEYKMVVNGESIDFEITKEDAKEYSKSEGIRVESVITVIIWVAIGVLMLLLFALISINKRNKKGYKRKN